MGVIAGAEELGAGPDPAADAASRAAARAAAAADPRARDEALAGRLRARQGLLERLGAAGLRVGQDLRQQGVGRRIATRRRGAASDRPASSTGILSIPPISPGLPPPSPGTCGRSAPIVDRSELGADRPAGRLGGRHRDVEDRQPAEQQHEDPVEQHRAPTDRGSVRGDSPNAEGIRVLDVMDHPQSGSMADCWGTNRSGSQTGPDGHESPRSIHSTQESCPSGR